MTGYKIGMAEEAVIANLTAKLAECQAWSDAGYRALETQTKALAECQAREAKLLDDIDRRLECAGITIYSGRPQRDDTALKEAIKQAKREALLEAAEAVVNDAQRIGSDWVSGHHADTLRRMAEELK